MEDRAAAERSAGWLRINEVAEAVEVACRQSDDVVSELAAAGQGAFEPMAAAVRLVIFATKRFRNGAPGIVAAK
jgi:hypothetical protein